MPTPKWWRSWSYSVRSFSCLFTNRKLKKPSIHKLLAQAREELSKLITDVQKKMQKAAADLNFEAAAELRDKMIELKKALQDLEEDK